jgi:hypothetical protein
MQTRGALDFSRWSSIYVIQVMQQLIKKRLLKGRQQSELGVGKVIGYNPKVV